MQFISTLFIGVKRIRVWLASSESNPSHWLNSTRLVFFTLSPESSSSSSQIRVRVKFEFDSRFESSRVETRIRHGFDQFLAQIRVEFESSSSRVDSKLRFERIRQVFIPNSANSTLLFWGQVMTQILLELASFGKNSSQLNSIRLFFPTHFTQYNNGNSQYDSNQ